MPNSYVVPLASDGKPVVFVKGDTVYTDSRTLAADAGKRHDNILQAIDNLLKDIAPQNQGALFSAVFEFSPAANRTVRHFEMTRDGFMLLAMGFTGKEWTEWKLRLIQAFNYMEEKLRELAEADLAAVLNNPSRLRAALADYAERVEVLESHVAVLEPKAAVYDQISAFDAELNVTRVAKLIGVNPHELFAWMRKHKWLYRADGNTPYQDKLNAGLMKLKIGPIQSGPNKGRVVSQPVLTGKGILQLTREFYAHRTEILWPLLARLEKDLKFLGAPS